MLGKIIIFFLVWAFGFSTGMFIGLDTVDITDKSCYNDDKYLNK